MTNYSEAKEEATRLTRMLGRDIEVAAEQCRCDEWQYCSKCGGTGTEYVLRYAFCDHIVSDGPDTNCVDEACAERERIALDAERRDMAGVALQSLREANSTRDEELEYVR